MTLAINRAREAEAAGFVLVAILATLLPLMIIAGAASTFLVGSAGHMQNKIAGTRAFLAAESGIDETIYRSNVGTLAGDFTLDMGEGMLSEITLTDLGTDGIDNDGDSLTDEADEDVLRVRSAGTYRGAKWTVVAYLGRLEGISVGVDSPVIFLKVPQVNIADFTSVSGTDVNIDGSPGSPVFDLPGMATLVGWSPNLLATISAAEALVITGTGGSPSVGLTTMDMTQSMASYRQAASNIISGITNRDVAWGDASSNDFQITYSGHDLIIHGNSRGAGILVVDGSLKTRGTFRFDGIIFVTGFVQLKENTTIFGALVMGINQANLQMHNNAKIQYSKQAIDVVVSMGSGYIMYNGWQKISNN